MNRIGFRLSFQPITATTTIFTILRISHEMHALMNEKMSDTVASILLTISGTNNVMPLTLVGYFCMYMPYRVVRRRFVTKSSDDE